MLKFPPQKPQKPTPRIGGTRCCLVDSPIALKILMLYRTRAVVDSPVMGVSKWMVYKGKSHEKMDDLELSASQIRPCQGELRSFRSLLGVSGSGGPLDAPELAHHLSWQSLPATWSIPMLENLHIPKIVRFTTKFASWHPGIWWLPSGNLTVYYWSHGHRNSWFTQL